MERERERALREDKEFRKMRIARTRKDESVCEGRLGARK